MNTYEYFNKQLVTSSLHETDYSYYSITLMQGQEKTINKWTQKYLNDYLSEIGGLFTSLMAGASFLMLGYQNFVA